MKRKRKKNCKNTKESYYQAPCVTTVYVYALCFRKAVKEQKKMVKVLKDMFDSTAFFDVHELTTVLLVIRGLSDLTSAILIDKVIPDYCISGD